jgi:hypothetical protein
MPPEKFIYYTDDLDYIIFLNKSTTVEGAMVQQLQQQLSGFPKIIPSFPSKFYWTYTLFMMEDNDSIDYYEQHDSKSVFSFQKSLLNLPENTTTSTHS